MARFQLPPRGPDSHLAGSRVVAGGVRNRAELETTAGVDTVVDRDDVDRAVDMAAELSAYPPAVVVDVVHLHLALAATAKAADDIDLVLTGRRAEDRDAMMITLQRPLGQRRPAVRRQVEGKRRRVDATWSFGFWGRGRPVLLC